MHLALQIDEILRMVASNLDVAHFRTKDLVSMASTCRAFSEPALYYHWQSLRGIEDLVRCLPDHLVGQSECQDKICGSHPYRYIKEVPQPHEWSRFRLYARRVRKFTIHKESECEAATLGPGSGTYRIIGEHYPGTQLFPFLQRLGFYGSLRPDRLGNFLSLALPPTLGSIEIFSSCEGVAFLFELIQVKIPGLKEFALRDVTQDMDWWSDVLPVCKTLDALRHLTHLTVEPPFTEETMERLARLPHLTSLSFHYNDMFLRPLSKQSGDQPAFRVLQELEVIVTSHLCDDTVGVTQWLGSIRPPLLRSFRIITPRVSSHQARDLFAPISTYTSLTDLVIFFMRNSFTEDDDTLHQPLEESALLPLTNLHDMKSFLLDGLPIDFTPSFAIKLALSWPNITSLNVAERCWLEDRDIRVQVSDLLAFAIFCPTLELLSFPVSCAMSADPLSTVDEAVKERLEEYDPSRSKMEIMYFSKDLWNDFPHTIEFIDKFFPDVWLERV